MPAGSARRCVSALLAGAADAFRGWPCCGGPSACASWSSCSSGARYLIGSLRPDGEPRAGRIHGGRRQPPVQRTDRPGGAQRVRSRGRDRNGSRRAAHPPGRDVEVEERGAGGLRARAHRAPAGLKPGEGLGAKVLGAVRNCDAILLVLRAFDDGGVESDAAGDLEALELEFVMADLDECRAAPQPSAPCREERRQGDRRRGRRARAGACRALRRHAPRTARRSSRAISSSSRRCSASRPSPLSSC